LVAFFGGGLQRFDKQGQQCACQNIEFEARGPFVSSSIQTVLHGIPACTTFLLEKPIKRAFLGSQGLATETVDAQATATGKLG
jgi:hypothetical protein